MKKLLLFIGLLFTLHNLWSADGSTNESLTSTGAYQINISAEEDIVQNRVANHVRETITYTVGSSGANFTSLTNANGLFNAINTGGAISGDIIVNIISDLTESGDIALNKWTETGAGNYTMLIQPSGNVVRKITGNGTNTNADLIKLNGAERVTIDGTANKYLTIKGNSAFVSMRSSVIYLFNANSCKILNCDISANASYVAGIYGIWVNGSNNEISKNKIHDLVRPNAGDVMGMYFEGGGSGTLISNNMINLFMPYNCNLKGIHFFNASNFKIYNNTVYLSGTSTDSDTGPFNLSAAFNVYNGTDFDMQNNIFYNVRTNASGGISKHYAVRYTTASPIAVSDYNLYYSAINTIGKYADKPVCTTLQEWQNATTGIGLDVHSQSSVIEFENVATGDLSMKRVPANATILNTGVALNGIADDFFGAARPQYSGFDIGAHELPDVSDIDNLDLPTENILAQNYPNPFNPSTLISYQLPLAGFVKLAVYNAKGELMKTLVKGMQSVGNHSVNFDGTGMNSGVYFYKLETPSGVMVKKMIMEK